MGIKLFSLVVVYGPKYVPGISILSIDSPKGIDWAAESRPINKRTIKNNNLFFIN